MAPLIAAWPQRVQAQVYWEPLAIVNSEVTSGNIIVNGGILNIEGGSLLHGTGTVTVHPGAALGFWSATAANVTRPIGLNGGTSGDPTSTGAITVFGTLNATGNNGTLVGSSGLVFYGGSGLGLNNSTITTAGAHVDRYPNADALDLLATAMTFTGRNLQAVDVTAETVGATSVAGGSIMNLNRSGASPVVGQNVELRLASLACAGPEPLM